MAMSNDGCGDGLSCELRARGYQRTISQIALKENAIVVLPTGTGKTQIAIMVISGLSHEIRKKYSEGGMRSFFLVPYKVLVHQQASEIETCSDFERSDIGSFTGDMNVDGWDKSGWEQKFEDRKVLVMTAQIFKDLIDRDYLPLDRVNLVVFDECHHAAMKKKNKETNDVYKQIMTTLKQKSRDLRPRILGLTASVINNRAEASTIETLVKDLESTYNARCISVEPEEVLRFRTNAVQVIWKCPPNYGAHKTVPIIHAIDGLIKHLEPMFRNWKDANKKRKLPIDFSDIKSSLVNIQNSAVEFGTWLAMQACQLYVAEYTDQSLFFKDTMPGFSALLLAVANFIGWCGRILQYVTTIHQRLLNTVHSKEVSCLRLVSPKLIRLLQILENYSNGSHKLKGILFVEKRWDAKVLSLWLEEVSKLVPSLSFLKPGYLIGYSNRPGLTSRLVVKSKFEQNETMKRFRMQDPKEALNILVATSVLEEGLNVTDCNLVIRFHPPATFKSWLQSMGRARAEDARYVLMPAIGIQFTDLMKKLNEFRDTYKVLNDYCLKRKMEEDGILQSNYDDVDEDDKRILDEQTVRSKTTSASIDAGKAISIVNCYCQQLDTDGWVQQPNDEQYKDGGQFFHSVTLPMNSVYTSKVNGRGMLNAKSAKKSAYLSLCQRLYDLGGLDEYLLPTRKKEIIRRAVADLNVEITYDPEDISTDPKAPKPGTSKMKRMYEKNVHPALKTGSGDSWFLYLINIAEDRKVLLKVIENISHQPGDRKKRPKERCFGFLTRQEIPLQSVHSSFPVFRQNIVKMDVSIELVIKGMKLTDEQEKELTNFHIYLFNEVLGFRNTRFYYQGFCKKDGPASNYLVVPLKNGKIDFGFIESVERKRNEPDGVIRNEDGYGILREDFAFKKEDYEDCLVMRWYNHSDNQNFKIPVEDKEEEHFKTLFTGAFHVLRIRAPCAGCVKCQNCTCENCHEGGLCSDCGNCKDCHGIFPRSEFPYTKRAGKNCEDWGNSLPKTYEDYYQRKYDIVIRDLQQPLLEVDYSEKLASPHIPIRLEGAKLFRRIQHFVPELCVICPIPLSLWQDAVCLPSVFFRLNQMLLSTSFLSFLNQEIGVGTCLNDKLLGPLNWSSSVASFVDKRMDPLAYKPKERSCLPLDLLDTSVLDNGNDNWDVEPMDVHESSSDDDESEMEVDEETGEMFHVVSRPDRQHDLDISPVVEDLEALRQSIDKPIEVEYPSNRLYGDVDISTSVEIKRTEELTIDSLQEEVIKGMDDCIANISKALHGISNSNDLSFAENEWGMDDGTIKRVPRRNLNCFGDVPPFTLKVSGRGLTPQTILEALTCKSAQDYLNLERYETMGDSFLKLAIIEYFHYKAPRLPEGCLTYIKGQHVSNYNLFRVAKKLVLGARMHVQHFHGHVTWSPPGFITKPKKECDVVNTTSHHVTDKQVADCVESLIGAILINCGSIDAIKFMSFLGLRVTDLTAEQLGNLDTHWIPDRFPPYQLNVTGAKEKIKFLYKNSSLSTVEKIINYSFKDKGWLLMAYTHSSYADNDVTGCYQRLEFLGDSVLDYLITRYLFNQKLMDKKRDFERFFDPGELTDLRSALVNNVFFGCVVTKYHLHKGLLASPDLKSRINTIADNYLQEYDDHKKARSYLEKVLGFYVQTGSVGEEGSQVLEMPKILGDIFEALFGAIYLDCGRDLNVVWAILYSMISEELKEFCTKIPRNPVQQVYLNDKRACFGTPIVTVGDEGKKKDVSVELKYFGRSFTGQGKNKKLAKIEAARQAIRFHELELQANSAPIAP